MRITSIGRGAATPARIYGTAEALGEELAGEILRAWMSPVEWAGPICWAAPPAEADSPSIARWGGRSPRPGPTSDTSSS